jgi:hypothetical protein
MLANNIFQSNIVNNILSNIVYKFSPGDVAPDNIKLWLDASDTSTTIDDTTPTQVEKWKGKADNNNATQSSGVLQPTTKVSTLNGLNVVDFDGSEALLLPSTLYDIPSGSNTLFCVFKSNEVAGAKRVVNMVQGGSTKFQLSTTSNNNEVRFAHSTGTEVTVSDITEYNIYSCYRDGVTNSLRANLETESTGSSSLSNICTNASIGAYNDTALYFDGSIAEIILFDKLLPLTERENMVRYLSVKWGIAI